MNLGQDWSTTEQGLKFFFVCARACTPYGWVVVQSIRENLDYSHILISSSGHRLNMCVIILVSY